LKPYRPDISPIIGEVVGGSPAEKAGLVQGDEIKAVDGNRIDHWEQFVSIIRRSPERTLKLEVLREEQILKFPITPETQYEGEEKIGRIGAMYQMDPTMMDRLLVNIFNRGG